MIPGLLALFFSAFAFFLSGGRGGQQNNQQNNQTNNPPDKTPPALVVNAPLSEQVKKPPTSVPTPALLPGLIGLGVAAFRNRKSKKDEAQV